MKRECTCKEANHQHGTRTMYVVDKCRCPDCTEATRLVEYQRRRAIAYGRYDSGRVDATPIRQHIRALMEQGVSYKQTAKVSGISDSAVGAILYGRHERGHAPYKRVTARTAAAILAVTPTLDNKADGATVDPIGTRRRLQALVAIGYSQARLATMIGMKPSNFTGVILGPRDVTARTAKRVRDIYNQLWDQPQDGGDDWRAKIAAHRAINRAKELGWQPPLAWDDDTIDDPATMPATGVDNELSAKAARAQALVEDVEWLVGSGATVHELVTRTGYRTFEALEKALERAGRRDLITVSKTQQANREYRRAS